MTNPGLRARIADLPPGPGPGDLPRWPGAPEQVTNEHGAVLNGAKDCHTCELVSTLGYRCSECGADLAGAA